MRQPTTTTTTELEAEEEEQQKKKKTTTRSSSTTSQATAAMAEIKLQQQEEEEPSPRPSLLRRAYSSTVRSSSSNVGDCCYTFLMPTRYPRYSEAEYMAMPEAQLDRLLDEYGLLDVSPSASLSDKRSFAVGAFLWKSKSIPI